MRRIFFWLHLALGVSAGTVILIMSATGVALTYEKQMLEWADRRAWSAPDVARPRLLPEAILATLIAARPDARPAGLVLRSDPSAPATVSLESNKTLLVDPYSGAIIGEPPSQPRAFFRTMTSWHRYLALEGASRATGRMITGAANLAFLFIVCSGMYLWLPKVWSWIQFKNVAWFRRGLSSKARDFNWHNVIGIWSAVPLAIVVAGALPISYSWAGNLIYRAAGEQPPAPAQAAARPPAASETAALSLEGINAGWSRAEAQVPSWRTITLRIPPSAQASLSFVIDQGYGGQPQKRGTLTIDRSTGEVAKWETFADLSTGRQARTWFRFAHTGEFYGLLGQTIAGLASAGGAVLVYTGISLAIRRFFSWISRRGERAEQRKAA